MRKFIEVAHELTDKMVIFDKGIWYQTEDEIHVPQGDWEGLFHEIAHWIVASEEERHDPNLALVTDRGDTIWDEGLGSTRCATQKDVDRTLRREYQACFIELELTL